MYNTLQLEAMAKALIDRLKGKRAEGLRYSSFQIQALELKSGRQRRVMRRLGDPHAITEGESN